MDIEKIILALIKANKPKENFTPEQLIQFNRHLVDIAFEIASCYTKKLEVGMKSRYDLLPWQMSVYNIKKFKTTTDINLD